MPKGSDSNHHFCTQAHSEEHGTGFTHIHSIQYPRPYETTPDFVRSVHCVVWLWSWQLKPLDHLPPPCSTTHDTMPLYISLNVKQHYQSYIQPKTTKKCCMNDEKYWLMWEGIAKKLFEIIITTLITICGTMGHTELIEKCMNVHYLDLSLRQ